MFYLGLILLAVSIVLAVKFPHPTPSQWFVFRGLFALSIALAATELPGFLGFNNDIVTAGGAMAVFVVIYLLNPPKLFQPRKRVTSKVESASANVVAVIPSKEAILPSSIGKSVELLKKAEKLLFAANFNEARQAYDYAIALFKREQDRIGEANCLRGLGDLENRLGRLEEARKAYEEAIALFKRGQHRLGEANCLRGLGELESKLGHSEEARKAYEEAIAFFKREQHRLGEANCLLGLGYYESAKRPELAKQHFQQAARLYAEIGLLDWRDRALKAAQELNH